MGCLSLHTFSLGSSKAEQYFYFCLIILEATELPAGCQGSVMTAALTSTEHLGQFISLVIPRYSSSPPTFQSARPPPFLTSQQVIKRPRKHAEWKHFCHSSLTHTHTFPMWKPAWCQPFTQVPFIPAGHPEDCLGGVEEGKETKPK